MKKRIKNFIRSIDKVLFPGFYNISLDEYKLLLKKEIAGNKSVLDVGCGHYSPVAEFLKDIPYFVGVDGHEPAIISSREHKIHTENFVMNVLDVAEKFSPKSFDCVVALDLIEHFSKEEGEKMIKTFENIAKKKVIIFTPNGFVPQGKYDNNDFQLHKSGWSCKEMKNRGYRVIGINGLKWLKGEYAKPKFNPSLFWERISYITQRVTRRTPDLAFQIFCIKDIV
jgi:SAM-dependent methyltransferase